MKTGIRYMDIAGGPIENRNNTILIGVIFRDGYIEGLLSSVIKVDGTDATNRIIKMIKSSRFKEQIRILIFNGIALAGLNVLEPNKLENELDVRVMILNRRKQRPKELLKALREYSRLRGKDVKNRTNIIKVYGMIKPLRTSGIFIQSKLDEHYTKNFAEKAFEALRIAHIIARGVSTGESKGRL